MKRVLVIGIGSVIMKDDGIGVRVAIAIKDNLREHGIASLVGETDFQCCYDEIKPDDLLIIIDAMARGKEAGSVDTMLLSDALKIRSKLRTQHEFSLFDLIELHYPNIQGYLIGIEASEIEFGFDLSLPLQKRFDQICTTVLNTILKMKERENMHDTHLIEKIYQSIVALCKQNGVIKVNDIVIAVDEGSHIEGPHLLSHLKDRDSTMFGDWTIIHVEHKPYEKLTAVIKSIDGDGCE